MVGRPQPKGSNKSKEAADSIASAEHNYLKNKNMELAKALAQSKSDFTQVLAERDYLQRELLGANLHIKKLEKYIDIIEDSTKNTFNKIVGCSSDITKALQTIHLAKKITKKLESNLKDVSDASILQMSMDHKVGKESSPSIHNNSPNLQTHHSKTHAVKPMVSGHVIFRPIISLRRVNEEEIERSMNIGAQQPIQHASTSLVTEEAVTEEIEQQQNTSFRCRSTSCASSHLSSGELSDENISDAGDEEVPTHTNETEGEREIDNKLETLQEEDESEPLTNSEHQSERNSKDMMIGLFTGVKLFTYNSAQNVSPCKKRSNLSCNGGNSSTEDSEAGTVPLVTTNRGTGERVNYANFGSSPNLSSYSVENETTLLSRIKCDSSRTVTESLSEPSTSGLRLRRSIPQKNDMAQAESKRNISTIISGTKSFKTFVANGTTMNSPNVLLENLDDSEILKIQQLSVLGLEPKFLKDNTSTPFTPVVRIKRRIEEVSSSSDVSLNKTPGTPPSTSTALMETTPQRKISHQNIKSSKNKKQVIIANPRVILKRMKMPKRNSRSPLKTQGSKISKRTSSQSSIESNDSVPSENRTRLTKRSIDSTRSEKRSRGSREQTPKKRKSSAKRPKKGEIELLSPQRLTDSPIRPRRRLPIKSFKEPSLVRKMRRSK
ncbi:uncharacterized protein LOC108734990 isoform X3 [Agrilus planipennis]|uniref:Uncharacterized protein LOC108734990 isoform X3 n=1 Tax=Agrilus planipennis TaxID=224129 RepID=A0A1W4WEC4_AGRPL|nr:uncharacterized protein LOC108734990 isoform X3 [Agrilus planipennis]